MFNVDAIDIGFYRSTFMRYNKQEGKANIREGLDRVLASLEWITNFDHIGVIHLFSALLDHVLIQLCLKLDHQPKAKPLEIFRNLNLRPFVYGCGM